MCLLHKNAAIPAGRSRRIKTGTRTARLLRRLLPLVCLLAGLLPFSQQAFPQMAIRHLAVNTVPPDSIDSLYHSRRHFWRAGAETVGFNLGLWAFDRYVQKGDFAYINFNTIKENFRHGFIWDNDKLGTNTFLHPYNGSLYFNAGRANGFNFWQSELFAIGGSWMWEMFMEREYPSTNDFIATPIGGAALGEILYRTADALTDDRTVGAERFERELAAFIISPMRGFNRIITGDAWKIRATPGRAFGTPPLYVRFSAGAKVLRCRDYKGENRLGFAAQLDLEYGNRFDVRSKRPYDYFTVRAELQGMKSQPLLTQLEIRGRLLGRELFESFRSHGSIGLYQHFDFYDSDTVAKLRRVPFKLGIPACVGAGFMYRDVERHRWLLDAYAHANAVILGSIVSDHYTLDCRNYNWASGFSIKAGFNLVFRKDILALSLQHEYYRLFTWRGYRTGTDLASADYRTLNVMGDHSVASFNVLEARADVRLWRRMYATATFNLYNRSTHYRDFPDVRSSSYALRLMLTYKL